MLYGIGSVALSTLDLNASSVIGQNVFAPQCVAGLSLTPTVATQEAKCYIDGVITTRASRITATDWMAELSYEFIDWSTLQLALGELATTGSYIIPQLQTLQVTSATVTITGLTAALLPSLKVYNLTDGQFCTLVASAPAGNQYTATGAANSTITFASTMVGKSISVSYNQSFASAQAIGETANADQVNNFKLSGVVNALNNSEEGYVFVANKISRMSLPTISLAGGNKATLNIQYKLITEPGERKPFKLYKLA